MKNVLALIPQEIQFHMGQQQWHFSSFLGTVCAVKITFTNTKIT